MNRNMIKVGILAIGLALGIVAGVVADNIRSPMYFYDVVDVVTSGALRYNGTAITATAAEINTLDGITASVSELNALDGVLDGVGSATNTGVTATEAAGYVQKTTLTLASVSVPVTYGGDGTNSTGNIKVYDFPAGRILVLGVTADNLYTTTNTLLFATSTVSWAIGTVAAAGDEMTTTEVDLGPASVAANSTSRVDIALASSAQFDGTATAKDAYLNMLVSSNCIAGAVTATVSGTITMHWVNLGDY